MILKDRYKDLSKDFSDVKSYFQIERNRLNIVQKTPQKAIMNWI